MPDRAHSPAFESADKFYFDQLRRGLELLRQDSAATHLREHLNLVLANETPAGANKLLKLKVGQRFTAYTLRLNAVSGEVISWYSDFLAAAEGGQSMTEDEALELAKKVASPPADAKPGGAQPEQAGERKIIRVRWSHEHGGLPVERDFIEVLINPSIKRAFACTRFWREPNLSGRALER